MRLSPLLAFALGFSAATAGCGMPASSCPSPAYRGLASDEAYLSMLDAKARAVRGDPQAPVLQTPAQSEIFQAAASPLPTFRWSSPLRAEAPRPYRPRTRSAWELARSLVVSDAWAHQPPVTSDLYYLEFSLPDQACPLTVLTSELFWPAEAEAWADFEKAGTAGVTLDVTSAYFEQNRVTEGPFSLSAPVRFEVSR